MKKIESYANVWDALANTMGLAVNLSRAELTRQIGALVKNQGWTQVEAAERCGVTQPRMNDRLRGRVSRFSLDGLLNISEGAGCRVRPNLEATSRESTPAYHMRSSRAEVSLKSMTATVPPRAVETGRGTRCLGAVRSPCVSARAAQRPSEPRLRDHVLGYFATAGFLPRPLQERHLPGLEVAIVLNFAAPHRILDPADPTRKTEHSKSWIVALQHRHRIQEACGARDFMVIRCTPVGARMLRGASMNLLRDRIPALEDLDSRFSRLLTGHAEATHDWAARFDIVENIIAERLASAPAPPAGLLHSWRMLQESPNDVDLARLQGEFGCSRRHLIAQFHTHFGMAPKTIVRISRFHRAVAAVHRAGWRETSSHAEGEPYLDRGAAATVRSASRAAIRRADLGLGCNY